MEQAGDNKNGGIFGGLDDFGIKDAGEAQIYEPEKESRRDGAPDGQASTVSIERGLFKRAFICPVCGAESKIPAVRTSYIRLIREDTDFMPVYRDPNPLYYYVTMCVKCGYAAVPAHMRNLTDTKRALIRAKITAGWKFEKTYPVYYTPENAIEIHKLALYNAVVSNEKESVRGVLCLHIGWLYRIREDAANEKVFLLAALEGLKRAYENETGAVGKLDKSSQEYLIGELTRRTGNPFGALNWFKLVLLDKHAKFRVKEMARDQKDIIMREYEASKKAGT